MLIQMFKEYSKKAYHRFIAAASIAIGLFTVIFCIRRRSNNNRKLYNDHGADDSRIRQSVERANRAAEEARSTIEKIKKSK